MFVVRIFSHWDWVIGKEGWESGSSLWKRRVGGWKFSLAREGERVAILFGKEGWESGNSLWKGRVRGWKFSFSNRVPVFKHSVFTIL